MIAIILSLTCKIFMITLTGFAGAKANVISETMKKNLSSLLTQIVLPFSIIASSQQVFSRKNLTGLVQSLGISVIYYLVTILILIALVRHMNISEGKKRIFVLLVTFANVGFIGFSVIGELLGEVGTLYTVAHNSAYQLFFFSFGIYYLKDSKGFSVGKLFQNRIIWISICAIILYLIPFRMPNVLTESITLVGSMMMPLSMLIVGAEIGGMSLSKVLCNGTAYLATFLRMIVCPLGMIFMMKILDVSSNVAITAVILTALPSGSLNVIMAKEYDREPEFATIVVAQNMILMMFLLPLFLMVSKYLF